MNDELHQLFVADQQERENHPEVGTPDYVALRSRDHTRRQQVQQMLALAKSLVQMLQVLQSGLLLAAGS